MTIVVEEKLNELIRLKSSGNRSTNSSIILELFEDFIKKDYEWAIKLDKINSYPFFDIVGIISPNIEVPSAIMKKFQESYITNSTAESRACKNYLKWQCLIEENYSIIESYKLPDPYESMVKLFKNGGGFSIEHGWLVDVQCSGKVIRSFDVRDIRKR